jgi:hypothetical protein
VWQTLRQTEYSVTPFFHWSDAQVASFKEDDCTFVDILWLFGDEAVGPGELELAHVSALPVAAS